MAGIITEPIAATSATAEPEISAKNKDTPTLTMARPPRRKPINAETNAISRLEIPPVFIKAPARMNKGIAINGKLVAPSKIDSAAFKKPSGPFSSQTPIRALVRMATAIGNPIAIIANMPRRTRASLIVAHPSTRLAARFPPGQSRP